MCKSQAAYLRIHRNIPVHDKFCSLQMKKKSNNLVSVFVAKARLMKSPTELSSLYSVSIFTIY